MLNYLVIFLLLLWVLGVFTGQLFDGYTHLLLIGAVVALAIRYFTEKKLLH